MLIFFGLRKKPGDGKTAAAALIRAQKSGWGDRGEAGSQVDCLHPRQKPEKAFTSLIFLMHT
jgi:hypothetical protein